MPIKAMPMVPEVPQDEPVAREVIEQMIRVAGRNIFGVQNFQAVVEQRGHHAA
jgi:hypothetical protein